MFICYNSKMSVMLENTPASTQDGDNSVIFAGASLIKIELQMKNAVCGCSVITAHFQ